MAAELLYHKFMSTASKLYKQAVGKELNKIGLRYEDLLNSSRPAIAEALELADPEVVNGRMRRLKRASDLCLKHKNFTDYAPDQDMETFKMELWDDVKKIEKRNEEFALLNLHKT